MNNIKKFMAEKFLNSQEGDSYKSGANCLYGAIGSYYARTWTGYEIPNPDILANAVKELELESKKCIK